MIWCHKCFMSSCICTCSVLFTKVYHNMIIWDCQKTNSCNQISILWVVNSWPSGCLSLKVSILFPIWQKSHNSICWWVPGSIFTQIPSMFNVHESLKISTKFFNGLPNWKVLGEVLELNNLLTFPKDHTAHELLILIFHPHYHLQ